MACLNSYSPSYILILLGLVLVASAEDRHPESRNPKGSGYIEVSFKYTSSDTGTRRLAGFTNEQSIGDSLTQVLNLPDTSISSVQSEAAARTEVSTFEEVSQEDDSPIIMPARIVHVRITPTKYPADWASLLDKVQQGAQEGLLANQLAEAGLLYIKGSLTSTLQLADASASHLQTSEESGPGGIVTQDPEWESTDEGDDGITAAVQRVSSAIQDMQTTDMWQTSLDPSAPVDDAVEDSAKAASAGMTETEFLLAAAAMKLQKDYVTAIAHAVEAERLAASAKSASEAMAAAVEAAQSSQGTFDESESQFLAAASRQAETDFLLSTSRGSGVAAGLGDPKSAPSGLVTLDVDPADNTADMVDDILTRYLVATVQKVASAGESGDTTITAADTLAVENAAFELAAAAAYVDPSEEFTWSDMELLAEVAQQQDLAATDPEDESQIDMADPALRAAILSAIRSSSSSSNTLEDDASYDDLDFDFATPEVAAAAQNAEGDNSEALQKGRASVDQGSSATESVQQSTAVTATSQHSSVLGAHKVVLTRKALRPGERDTVLEITVQTGSSSMHHAWGPAVMSCKPILFALALVVSQLAVVFVFCYAIVRPVYIRLSRQVSELRYRLECAESRLTLPRFAPSPNHESVMSSFKLTPWVDHQSRMTYPRYEDSLCSKPQLSVSPRVGGQGLKEPPRAASFHC